MRTLGFGVLIACAAFVGLTGAYVQAAPGDTIPYTQNGFIDNASGDAYLLEYAAEEYWQEAGVGSVMFNMKGPRLSLHTVGKGWSGESEPQTPLAPIKIGKPNDQAVSIGDQVVDISTHAFVHADAPLKVVYIGTVTVDVRVEVHAGNIQVVIYTPKGQIKLGGKLFTH